MYAMCVVFVATEIGEFVNAQRTCKNLSCKYKHCQQTNPLYSQIRGPETNKTRTWSGFGGQIMMYALIVTGSLTQQTVRTHRKRYIFYYSERTATYIHILAFK